MRIPSLVLCTALVVGAGITHAAVEKAQAALDAFGVPSDHARTEEQLSGENLHEDLADSISELTFRSGLLASLDNRDFKASADADCKTIQTQLMDLVANIESSAKVASDAAVNEPSFKFLLEYLKTLQRENEEADTGAISSFEFALNSLGASLSSVQSLPRPLDFNPLLQSIRDAIPVLRHISQCTKGGSKPMITDHHCDSTAELYRALVDTASKESPQVASTASPELKRVSAGSLSVLDLSKNAIPKKNEALLTTRPIFTGDLLSQYRDEYLRVAENEDDFRVYAQASLGLVVGVSNALEACLRVAADPAAAAADLDADLDDEESFDETDDETDETDEEDK